MLADVALAWMMERVEACDLALDPQKRPALSDPHWTQDLKDSFAEFLRGLYRFINARYYRPIGTTPYGCEWLDRAAIERARRLEYRPRNRLGAHLGCEATTPETLQELVGGPIWHLLQKLGHLREGSAMTPQ